MARYGVQHKTETRQRIIDAAGRRLKQHGIDASGVASLMNDADLTNGAFYAHFASKADLVAHVIADQLDRQRATIDAIPTSRDALAAFIRGYLSADHRDDPADGCPTAALLSELAHCDTAVRNAYSEGAQSIIDTIAAHFPPGLSQTDRFQTALGLFTILVSSLQLARAVSDPLLSDQILEAGTSNAIRMLHHRMPPDK